MIRKPLSWSIKQVCTMIKKGSIVFDSPIQRPPGQWNQEKRSKLIESILKRFIPDFYAVQSKDENNKNSYSVIDGLQRFTTLCSFFNDEWELTELRPIKLESTGDTYNISGMKYSQLPEEVQEEIKSYTLTIKAIELEEDEDEEEIIEEIFYCLNSGEPMAKQHLALISASKNVQEFCFRMVSEHTLFNGIAKYTNNSIKKSDKQMTILQSIILIAGLSYESFAAKHVEEVFKNNEVSNEVLEKVEQAFTDIAETFKNTHKFVAKINIPIMAYMFAQTTEENKEQAKKRLLNYVNNEMKPGDIYKAYTGAGSVKKEKVIKRVEGMLEICGVVVKAEEKEENESEQPETEQEQPQEGNAELFNTIINTIDDMAEGMDVEQQQQAS